MELSLRKSDTHRRFKQPMPGPRTRVKILRHTKPIEESSASYQQLEWEKLKKHFNFLLSIVNAENVLVIKERLLKFNIVRAKGLFCSAILGAQLFQNKNSDLYGLLASIINHYFPNIAELLLIRSVWQLKSGYRQNCTTVYSSSAVFIAHLIYRGVANVSLGIDVLKLLFAYPTDEDLIKTAIIFYKICGEKMNKNCMEIEKDILKIVDFLSHDYDLAYEAHLTIQNNLLKPKIYNIQSIFESTNIDYKYQMVHNVYFHDIKDPLDFYDEFEVDIDFIANNRLYKLQVQKPKNLIDYGKVNDSDDADDEEEENKGMN